MRTLFAVLGALDAFFSFGGKKLLHPFFQGPLPGQPGAGDARLGGQTDPELAEPWLDDPENCLIDFFEVSHTAPIAFVLVDTLLTCHHAPDRKIGSIVVACLFLFYISM